MKADLMLDLDLKETPAGEYTSVVGNKVRFACLKDCTNNIISANIELDYIYNGLAPESNLSKFKHVEIHLTAPSVFEIKIKSRKGTPALIVSKDGKSFIFHLYTDKKMFVYENEKKVESLLFKKRIKISVSRDGNYTVSA